MQAHAGSEIQLAGLTFDSTHLFLLGSAQLNLSAQLEFSKHAHQGRTRAMTGADWEIWLCDLPRQETTKRQEIPLRHTSSADYL